MHNLFIHTYVHTYIHILNVDVMLNDTTEEGTIRLVGGATPLEGRVEIFLLGQWGTVCDYDWDLADATVVCIQLGFLRAVEAPRSATFGTGSGPSWYSYVRCAGTEQNLTECRKYISPSGNACSHSQDAGVMCTGESVVYNNPFSMMILRWYNGYENLINPNFTATDN